MQDPVSEKWKRDTMRVQKATVEDQLAAMGAATAQVVQLTAPAEDKVTNAALLLPSPQSTLSFLCRSITRPWARP